MRTFRVLGLLLIGLGALSVHAADKPAASGVVLKAEYQVPGRWTYEATYTSQGNFRQKASNTAKSTEIRCIFTAVKKAGPSLGLSVDSVSVTSDMYTQALQNEIRANMVKEVYSLSLAKGFPTIDTASAMPANGYLEWDLYRQLARLLPALPDKAVKKGFTWERTDMVPMETARGKITCEVYRTYTLTGLTGDTAAIHWKFRYAGSGRPDSSVLTDIPVFGSGNGAAVIDVRRGCILSASMNFTSPVATIGDISVVWHERAEIKLTKQE